MKKPIAIIAAAVLACGLLTACGGAAEETSSTSVQSTSAVTQSGSDTESSSAADSSSAVSSSDADVSGDAALADGVYTAEFNTDSSMFHVNEALDGKGTLTVKDGQMTIHIALTSQNIVNLFPGTAEEAQAEGAELLQPTLEEVTYSDGTTEEVNAFDVPVPALDEEFDCALIGTKGKWYDHKVSVSNPVAQ